ncbi:hypothetical protein BDA99DRAFT_533707 [Phascolomyces articulosus]|uniref:AMP-dependent synthetase/ligase domain-containing protein n=1 Tax=Phascolomyces articulosus TaxID=60185 RepID=A0AAD5PHI9_9FUNG|nr:hypothetical protein BDA99DRAFT_533707 [Phascolomyces articulosus]
MDGLELPKYTDYGSILQAFEVAVEHHKDKPLVHYQAAPKSMEFKTLTYREVDIITTYLANKWGPILLPAISSDEAQCVATIGHESPVQPMLMFFTILKLGLPYFTIRSDCDKMTTTHLLKLVKPGYIIASNTYFKTKLHLSTTMTINDVTIPVEPWEEYDMDYLIKVATTAAKEEQGMVVTNALHAGPDSTVLYMMTGGTTNGIPKVIARDNLSLLYSLIEVSLKIPDQISKHRNNNGAPLQHPCVAMESSDVWLIPTSFDRSNAIYFLLLNMLIGSSVLVFHNEQAITLDRIFTAARRMKVTWILSSHYLLLEQLGDYLQECFSCEETDATIATTTTINELKGCITGGAPLRPSIEKILKLQGLKLLPSFGTTEFGILGTSFVSGDTLLRANSFLFSDMTISYLSFEKVYRDTYQAVVRKNYPGLVANVENRPNGDFATGDLFIPNDDQHNSQTIWTYVGRLNDVFTLKDDKKVICPLRMELEVYDEEIIQNCVLIGENKNCTAILVELAVDKASKYSPTMIVNKVYEAVNRANKRVPSHYAVMVPSMVHILPLNKQLPLTLKRTVIRSKVPMVFAQEIEQIYDDCVKNSSIFSNNYDTAIIKDLSVTHNNNV